MFKVYCPWCEEHGTTFRGDHLDPPDPPCWLCDDHEEISIFKAWWYKLGLLDWWQVNIQSLPLRLGFLTPDGAYRVIRNGRVKIAGDWYEPDAHWTPYDGRLDGLCYHFARYPRGDSYEPFVALGSSRQEARYIRRHYEQWEREDTHPYDRPEVVEGTLPWSFWHKVAA